MFEFFDCQFLAAEGVLSASTALRTKEHELIEGEIPLVEDAEKLLSNSTTGANDSNFHFVTLYR